MPRFPCFRLSQILLTSYAQFPDGLIVWVFDNRGIESAWIAVTAHEFEQVARRFSEQCADQNSSLSTLRRDGRQLYQWLVAPIANHLTTDRVLVFETDGAVSQIPLSALSDLSGNYLSSRYAIVISPGVGYGMHLHHSTPFSPQQRALIIANPSLDGELGAVFPPLPDATREADAISARFKSPSPI